MLTQVETTRGLAECILSNSLAERIARKRGFVPALDTATGRTVVIHRHAGDRFEGSRAWVKAAAACIAREV